MEATDKKESCTEYFCQNCKCNFKKLYMVSDFPSTALLPHSDLMILLVFFVLEEPFSFFKNITFQEYFKNITK